MSCGKMGRKKKMIILDRNRNKNDEKCTIIRAGKKQSRWGAVAVVPAKKKMTTRM
jgi:hypothetical protein